MLEPGDLGLVDAVAARPDGEANNSTVREGALVERDEVLEESIGVGKGLQVDDELARPVAAPKYSIPLATCSGIGHSRVAADGRKESLQQ